MVITIFSCFTVGKFCACTNSNTNTYWCVRTVNVTHNYLYCEFVSGIITYYDLTVDPYQLRNIYQTLSDAELNYMHRQLLDLKVYSGYDDFEDGDRLKRRLEGKHHKKHHQLQHQQGARKHQKSFSNKFGESRARAAAGNGMKYSRVSWFYS